MTQIALRIYIFSAMISVANNCARELPMSVVVDEIENVGRLMAQQAEKMFFRPKCIKLTRNLSNKTSQTTLSAIVFPALSEMESDLCLSSRYSNFLIPATLNKIRIMSRDAFLCVVMEPSESFVHFPPDWQWSMLKRNSLPLRRERGSVLPDYGNYDAPLRPALVTVTGHKPRFDTEIHGNY